jgi:non-ribosomal peptide synthase protein (TIGR01720 family)
LRPELAYWLAQPWSRAERLPLDYPRGVNSTASARTVSVALSTGETRDLLQEVPEAYHTQINDVLLTALTRAFAQWTEVPTLLLDLEGHGREPLFEDVDVSRTVGWFTALFPVLLELETASYPGDSLKSIKEQLRRIPNRGLGYGLLRYVRGDEAIANQLRSLPQAEVSFNYLGQWDQTVPESWPFRPASESSGPPHSQRGSRRYLLEIKGSVVGGRLQMAWTYSEQLHRRTTIEDLAQAFMEELRLLIDHCQSPEAGGYTASDFPQAKLSQRDLDKVLARIGPTVRR